MIRILFTTEDNSKQLTVITDGIDSQLNVFVTENTVGDVDYFESLGIVIEPGHTYNIGKFKELAFANQLRLLSYPEGLNEEAMVLQDIQKGTIYTFEITTPELTFTNEGGTQQIQGNSYKQTYVNGKPEGEPEAVQVTYVESGEGFAVDNSGKVTAGANMTANVRNGQVTCTQAESGKIILVTLTQAASDITYEYTLSVTPTSLSFANTGETKSYTVTSTKQKKVNGTPEGSPENVSYTTAVVGDGFAKLSDSDQINASENTAPGTRVGTATITQSESSKQTTIGLTQLGTSSEETA